MTNDKLGQLLGDTKYSKRRDIWLWLTLNSYGCQMGPLESAPANMRDTMASWLDVNPSFIERAKSDQIGRLLPEENFSWINEGRRQIEWVKSRLSFTLGYSWMYSPINLNGMDLVYYIIDGWEADLTQKQLVLSHTKIQWEQHKNGDKEFKWFKDNDQKSSLAWEVLKKCTPVIVGFQSQFESYEDLLIFFDRATLTNEQKELYISKIKKRWNQQKYREKLNGKAQYNFILSDKAIGILNKLSETHEITRARVLELLLEMEDFKGDHIAERVRMQKLLNTDLP